MQTESIRDIITALPFFDSVSPAYIDIFCEHATHMQINNGHFLLTRGSDASQFYFIETGKVHIEMGSGDKGPVTIQALGPNDLVGWSFLIPPFKWRFDALAVEPTSVLAIDGATIRNKCESDHSFGFDMMKRIAKVITDRLLHTRMQLMEFYV